MIATFGRERPLLLAISGIFLLLPMAMLLVFAPPPAPAQGQDGFQAMIAYYQSNQLEYLLVYFWISFGQFAIATVLAAPDRPSVGEALRRCVGLLPWFLLIKVAVLLITMAGFMMLIVPALYFSARLAPSLVLLGTGEAKTPAALITPSVEMTRGAGWHIAAFMVLLWIGTSLFATAIGTISSALFTPLKSSHVALVADALIQSAANVPSQLLSILFAVSLWRMLKDRDTSSQR